MAFGWKDVGNIIGDIAPVVGTALGGPAGGAVGGLIANLLGTDTDADAVAKAIKADPSIAVKIKEIELEAQKLHNEAIEKERQAKLDEQSLYVEDVQSAREMQVAALSQEDIFSKRFLYYFAAFWSIVGVVYIFCITFIAIPKDSIRFADTILGFLLGTILSAILQYFFGSSKGSADKTEQLIGAVATKAVAK